MKLVDLGMEHEKNVTLIGHEPIYAVLIARLIGTDGVAAEAMVNTG